MHRFVIEDMLKSKRASVDIRSDLLEDLDTSALLWKQFGWCCENLYNSTNKEYSVDDGYPQNPPVLQGDDNSLFIGIIQERINVCPWCGEYVNKEHVKNCINGDGSCQEKGNGGVYCYACDGKWG